MLIMTLAPLLKNAEIVVYVHRMTGMPRTSPQADEWDCGPSALALAPHAVLKAARRTGDAAG